MNPCELCPRLCGVDRTRELGACGQGDALRIARAALHPYEEPCISGTRGSGTVFFCGCNLGCVFCQNRAISRARDAGHVVSVEELSDIFLELQEQGAHNVNLVTPTHFADKIADALRLAKPRLRIPVVYNSSGYERVSTLRSLEGLIDVYMPDFKYLCSELSSSFSSAPDYASVVCDALCEMYRQVGPVSFSEGGLLSRGLLVRHLILPGCRHDSLAVLERLAALLPVEHILLSLMSQYTPDFAADHPDARLHRRLTTFEYESVLDRARELGFRGFEQERSSARAVYTPDF